MVNLGMSHWCSKRTDSDWCDQEDRFWLMRPRGQILIGVIRRTDSDWCGQRDKLWLVRSGGQILISATKGTDSDWCYQEDRFWLVLQEDRLWLMRSVGQILIGAAKGTYCDCDWCGQAYQILAVFFFKPQEVKWVFVWAMVVVKVIRLALVVERCGLQSEW